MSRRGALELWRVWKRFRGDPGSGTVGDGVLGLPARLRDARKTGRRRGRGWRWALRDVDLEARPGEAIGVVGLNGSGKSTLLRVVGGVMTPYAGRVRVEGRVGALIDVWAGIHPLLSGRENVYLYGSLLGLSRRATKDRFDEIVAFAELEDAIDRQVKFYSAGMHMRLGFAVAAFLEPDVLLVDEVLAVGDSAFQQRCLEQMSDVLDDGSTLVFVSHDLPAIEATCRRGIWLRDGTVAADGPIHEVVASYSHAVEDLARVEPARQGPVRLVKIEHRAPGGSPTARSFEPWTVTTTIESDTVRVASLHLGFSEGMAGPTFALSRELQLRSGENLVTCEIEYLPLARGKYAIWLGINDPDGRELVHWHPVADFDVMGPNPDATPHGVARTAPVVTRARWELGPR
jgi:ABC-type polysaccharide/polyol phosphate transport system ATPase subunit